MSPSRWHRLLCRSNHDRRIEGWDPREPRTNEQGPYESTREQLFECLVWICAPALSLRLPKFLGRCLHDGVCTMACVPLKHKLKCRTSRSFTVRFSARRVVGAHLALRGVEVDSYQRSRGVPQVCVPRLMTMTLLSVIECMTAWLTGCTFLCALAHVAPHPLSRLRSTHTCLFPSRIFFFLIYNDCDDLERFAHFMCAYVTR